MEEVEDLEAAQPALTRKLEPWEERLRERLILNSRINKSTGEEEYSVRNNSANVATVLRYHPKWEGVLSMDTFHERIVTTRTPPWHRFDAPTSTRIGSWADDDLSRLGAWFARTNLANMNAIEPSKDKLMDGIVVAAGGNERHPVRAYLESTEWDGVPRVNGLAANYLGGESTSYAQAVGSCFLIGAVARVMDPGCKVDMCPILEGEQGTRKSSALAVLGGTWYSDSDIAMGSKDGCEVLRGSWIVELPELASLTRANAETAKAFLSKRIDKYRPSYARFTIDSPRQTVFVGTTNASTYLSDASGARRFPPLRTGAVDLGALKRDRDQIWAEALHRYRAGEEWWFDQEVAKTSAVEAEARYVFHPWETLIRAYLEKRPNLVQIGVTTDELIIDCGVERGRMEKKHNLEVSDILRRLGWGHRQRVSREGTRRWVYKPSKWSWEAGARTGGEAEE